MTLTADKPSTKAAPVAAVPADTAPDVRLSVAEQEALLHTTAAETTKAEVPTAGASEQARAWSAQAEID